jgi:hypothetical protein
MYCLLPDYQTDSFACKPVIACAANLLTSRLVPVQPSLFRLAQPARE